VENRLWRLNMEKEYEPEGIRLQSIGVNRIFVIPVTSIIGGSDILSHHGEPAAAISGGNEILSAGSLHWPN
jgi:hypothetical protein